ncbi:unnamed protein product [Ranitomeya imitator]|uniref:Coronin n=1 Tax=Ranitomeya imitator TaxID=111125 RepID=A0ABN9MAH2_9NEOB|nr:unnamed protein product [Ranitomeya imitator]
MKSSSGLHAAAPAQAYFVCPVEGRAKYCSAQAPGLSDLFGAFRTVVLSSALNRADKVRLRQSRGVKTRRGRHGMKMGGAGAGLRHPFDRTAAGPPLEDAGGQEEQQEDPGTPMSWQPQYRNSKYRHVFGKPANKENCYDNVPITRSVHDNQFCAVNPSFIAVVTECAGGGAFIVIPIQQSGKLDPHYPKVCGHRGNVLDIKWNPFDDYVIASCSEDTSVKIWDIPKPFVTKNIIDARKELVGHARRVGLIEWHPTASNIIFSTAYDYKTGESE